MSFKTTWYWLLAATGLLAFIFLFHRYHHRATEESNLILPKLDPAAVTFIQVRPGPTAGEIRAQRTNHVWTLTEPLVYPAQDEPIDKLLSALAKLTPATYLSEAELRLHTNADAEFGLDPPQVTLILTQANDRAHLQIGARTTPGDQVFLKVVAREGLYVVDASLLDALPRRVDDWRNRDLFELGPGTVDRLAVTNNGKSFVVHRESTNDLWRIVWPLFQARADGTRIDEGLSKLETLQVQEFVTDDPKADLDSFGLQTPSLELALGQGSNTWELLQVGKSPTNHSDQVFARRAGRTAIVTVPKAPLADWVVDSVNSFRDPHLLELVAPVEKIEVSGEDRFTLEQGTNHTWRVLPGNFAADGALVTNLIETLTSMTIVQFQKDVATPANWPEYGLAAPARRYVLKTGTTNLAGTLTNGSIADLSFGFGTNQTDRVFVRRADEESVYAVTTNAFALLPSASWQMRERRVWHFGVDDLAGLTIRQGGKVRELVRRGDHQWSLAAGSQGIIEEAAIEESVHNLLAAPALSWVAVGETNRTRCGFAKDGQEITFLLKDGQKPTLEFGGDSPGRARYAGVTLDGQFWVMELPWALYRYVLAYLSLPAGS